MTTEQTKHIIQLLTDKGVHFDSGLTDDEVSKIETKFNFKFPPDLKLFLQTGLPTSDHFVNWRLALDSNEEADKIISRLDWPLEGMLFDIESNNFWANKWGSKPDKYADQASIAKKYFETYPRLIPIFSHRYISSRPNEIGNPIISVHQMDIIYYGNDLATYFANEFHFVLPESFEIPKEPKMTIEFWSDYTG